MTVPQYTAEIQTRYRDIDSMGHVNNAVYATYLEKARMSFFNDILGVRIDQYPSVIVHVEIDYLAPITFDNTVLIDVWVSEIGTSSIRMDYTIFADEQVAAKARSVLAVLDESKKQSAPIPEDWRDRLQTA